MNEKEKQTASEELKNLQEKKQKIENTIISRRSFLGKAGGMIAYGLLAHFIFIGKIHARDEYSALLKRRLDCAIGTCVNTSSEGQVCYQNFTCDPSEACGKSSIAIYTEPTPPPCTKDCLVSYLTDCFAVVFDTE